MARKWRIGPNTFAWNFELCEELVFIAGYEEIRPFVPSGQTWLVEFEQRYFMNGDGLAAKVIEEINLVRRRKELPLLEVA